MGKILATHTGSLVRPPELLSFLAEGARLATKQLFGAKAEVA